MNTTERRDASTTPIALIGLGATGLAIARALDANGRADRIAGAVDSDPAKAGKDLATLTGMDTADCAILPKATDLTVESGGVAVVTTSSRVEEVLPMIMELVDRGLNVISLCEELSYPWRSHPDVARKLDEHASAAGVSVLGTGANPGFMLDVLPLVFTAALLSVERVEVERTVDISDYGPLMAKFGFGLTPDEFARRRGVDVVGHIGFEQSLAHLCDRLGFEDAKIEVGLPDPILIVPHDRSGEHVSVPQHTVGAIEHVARAIARNGEIVVRGRFGMFRPGDGITPHDVIRVAGNGRVLEIQEVSGGFDSKPTTIAVLVNAIDAIASAPPGLRTMSDLSIGSITATARADG